MEVLSFRTTGFRLPLRHVVISMRIGNEVVHLYRATVLNRTNLRATGRKGKFKAVSLFYLRGIGMSTLFLDQSRHVRHESARYIFKSSVMFLSLSNKVNLTDKPSLR